MSLVVDTVGKITLPDGEEVTGVILVGSIDDVREAAQFWAGRVRLVSAEDTVEIRQKILLKIREDEPGAEA